MKAELDGFGTFKIEGKIINKIRFSDHSAIVANLKKK